MLGSSRGYGLGARRSHFRRALLVGAARLSAPPVLPSGVASRFRNALALSQEALAEKADISPRYLQFVESGKSYPTVVVAARLRGALGCSWEEMCRGL